MVKWPRLHLRLLPVLAILFALVATGLFAYTRAAAGSIAVEAEKGTIANGASVISNTSASGGQAVKFSTGGGGGSSAPMPYPSKAVALYYMMWPESGSPKLSTIPSNVNVVNLAFAQNDPPGLVGWSAQGQSSFIADANALRARGVRIVISIGGAGGNVNVGNRTAFVNGIMAINAQVPLDGIDWDVEGGSMNTSDVAAISVLLKQQRGDNFAVTMAPNGSNVDQYIGVAVALEAADALDMIGQQFYDAPVSADAALGRINQMIGAGIPESKVAIGMMIANDGSHWTVSQCVDNVNYLKGKHPNLRGGYLWEAGRSGTAEWASQVGPLLMN